MLRSRSHGFELAWVARIGAATVAAQLYCCLAPADAVSWPGTSESAAPACFTPVPPQRGAVPHRNCPSETGTASWYGKEHQGQPTASGEIYDRNRLTAAHPTLPMNTRVRVTHIGTGRTVIVRINDRGPYVGGRIIDLSEKAAQLLGFKRRGFAMVRLEIMD